MKRAPLLLLLVAAPAGAWEQPEHAAFGRAAFELACAEVGAGNCDPGDEALAAQAIQDPDDCHSVWHSSTGIAINPEHEDKRAGCQIAFGHEGGYTPAWNVHFALGKSPQDIYALATNENHFGALSKAHYEQHHQLAKLAASRYQELKVEYATPPDPDLGDHPNPILAQCHKATIGLEAFALHYLTDATATGHGWTPEARYAISAGDSNKMNGLRACVHGQPFCRRAGVSTVSFDCLDALDPVTGTRVYYGLSDGVRNMSDDLATGGPWQSDGYAALVDSSCNEANPELDPAAFVPNQTQLDRTMSPATRSFAQVIAPLYNDSATVAADVPWSDSFVSNLEMCRVVVPMCCRAAARGDLGTCDACAPDVGDSEIKTSCPIDTIQIASGPDGDLHWVALGVSGLPVLHAHLVLANDSRSDLARNLARTATYAGDAIDDTHLLLHPDAQWNVDNKVVDKLGCVAFELHRATPTGAKVHLEWSGNPRFPLTGHFLPDTTPGACTSPACTKQSFAINVFEQPDGSKPTTADADFDLGTTGAFAGTFYLTDATGAWSTAAIGDDEISQFLIAYWHASVWRVAGCVSNLKQALTSDGLASGTIADYEALYSGVLVQWYVSLLHQGVQDGVIAFDPVQAKRCVQAVETGGCTQAGAEENGPSDCATVFSIIPQASYTTQQLADLTFIPCNVGLSCTDTSLHCSAYNDGNTFLHCEPFIAPGGHCDTFSTAPCTSTYYCDDSYHHVDPTTYPTNTCVAGLPDGASCSNVNSPECASSCYNGTCTISPVVDGNGCGREGQACCDGSGCDDWVIAAPGSSMPTSLTCSNGTCTRCGGNDGTLTCCAPNSAVGANGCAPAATCDAQTTTCVACGGAGQECCDGNACDAQLACDQSSHRCR